MYIPHEHATTRQRNHTNGTHSTEVGQTETLAHFLIYKAIKRRHRSKHAHALAHAQHSYTMGDNAAQQNKKRKSNWETSYSAMSIRDAEKRLGIRIDKLKATPIDTMLAKPNSLGGADVNKETVDAVKVKVYEQILQYLAIEGYPTEANPDFNEANVSDLVFSTIGPVLYFVQKMRRDIRLTREKEITLVDDETGGVEVFVVVDQIAVSEEKFVLVIEAKRTSIRQAIKQLLLSLKDV
jgi:hypothetical protein